MLVISYVGRRELVECRRRRALPSSLEVELTPRGFQFFDLTYVAHMYTCLPQYVIPVGTHDRGAHLGKKLRPKKSMDFV